MAFLKNNSLRLIHVAGVSILPGQVSDELPDDVMEYAGVKALMKARELEEAGDPEEAPKARASAAPPPQPNKAPPPPQDKK